jgi:hypothetical protein
MRRLSGITFKYLPKFGSVWDSRVAEERLRSFLEVRGPVTDFIVVSFTPASSTCVDRGSTANLCLCQDLWCTFVRKTVRGARGIQAVEVLQTKNEDK